jgi:tetratricopeptide (TPR) repeat protein
MLSARINLGNALKGQQRYADADREFRGALSAHPESPELLFNLGILYLDGSLPGMDAIDRLQQALKFFEGFKDVAENRPTGDPTDAYIGETNKRIVVEQKKLEQQRKSSKPAPAPEPAAEGEAEPDEEAL